MAGHKNRATKSCKKLFTSRWQLSLFAQKPRQKYIKNCLELFTAPSYLGLSFLKDVTNLYFCAVRAHCASGTLLQIFCNTTSEKSCKNDEKRPENHRKPVRTRRGVLKWCLPTNSTIADRSHLVSCLKSFIGGRVVRIVPFLLPRAVLLVGLRVG